MQLNEDDIKKAIYSAWNEWYSGIEKEVIPDPTLEFIQGFTDGIQYGVRYLEEEFETKEYENRIQSGYL